MRRELLLSLVLATAAAAPASGQSTAERKTCTPRQAIGFIGIAALECTNCSMGSADPDRWIFRTEPRITAVDADARGGALLKPGDVITHVNGNLITTRTGARALATIEPGQTVILTVRRNGEQLKYAIVAETGCAAESRPGMYAPSRAQGDAPSVKYHAVTPTPAPTVRGGTRIANAPVAVTTIGPRASFGFGLGCSNCAISAEQINGVHVMMFDRAPEIAYIDVNGPAYKAGMRRGDVLTHVDGSSLTTVEGARKFSTAEAGKPVRFTVRRNGQTRTYRVSAVQWMAAPAPTPDLAKSSESLERAQRALQELQREQSRQMAQIQQELQRSRALEQDRVRELQREFYRKEQDHRRKLSELSSELARAESRMRAALADSARASCSVVTASTRPGSRTLRYTGVLGGSEIEVRGSAPVNVTETTDEVTISVGSTQVKVKKVR